jgi:hypothetical protein
MWSWATGSSDRRSWGVPLAQRPQSKPWKSPRQTSYFSSITATASPSLT